MTFALSFYQNAEGDMVTQNNQVVRIVEAVCADDVNIISETHDVTGNVFQPFSGNLITDIPKISTGIEEE